MLLAFEGGRGWDRAVLRVPFVLVKQLGEDARVSVDAQQQRGCCEYLRKKESERKKVGYGDGREEEVVGECEGGDFKDCDGQYDGQYG